jgi:hypothetical protein
MFDEYSFMLIRKGLNSTKNFNRIKYTETVVVTERQK